VSWGYLRVHNPDLIVSMLQDANAGKLRCSALTGLGSPEKLDRLLAVSKNVGESRRRSRSSMKRSASSQKNDAPPAKAKGPSKTSPKVVSSHTLSARSEVFSQTSWGQMLAASGGLALMRQVDCAPRSLRFSPVYDGQSSRETFKVTSPTDGSLRAALPEDSPFPIYAMRAHNGVLSTLVVRDNQSLNLIVASPLTPNPLETLLEDERVKLGILEVEAQLHRFPLQLAQIRRSLP